MTFRSRIIVFLLVAAVVPVAISGLLFTKISQDELISRISQSHENNAYLVADDVNRFLGEVLKSLRLSTELILFEGFPREELADAVRIPYGQFEYLNALVLIKPDGSQLSEVVFESSSDDHSEFIGHQRISEGDLDIFRQNVPLEKALAQGQGFSSVYFGKEQNRSRLAVALSFPVSTEEGNWVLAAEISLAYINKKLKMIAPQQGGSAFVVDQRGRIVSHNDSQLQLAQLSLVDSPLFKKVFQKKKTGANHFIFDSTDGEQMTGAFALIPVMGWGVVVEQETKHAFRSAQRIRWYTVFWIFIGIVIAMFGGLILSQGISKPIMKLAQGVKAVEKGDFSFVLEIESNDVIGQLGRAFNHMTGELFTLIEQHENLFVSSIHTLVASVEAKDVYTRGHSERVTGYTLALCDASKISPEDREIAELASLLHDVGKIGIPEELLNKPGAIGSDEFATIQGHPLLGERIVSKIRHPQIEEVSALVRGHHEKWDGTGYPDRLKGEEIPLVARILSIADAYDAMTSDRAYRAGMPSQEALSRLKENAGTQFDPILVETFCTLAQDNRLEIVQGESKYVQSDTPDADYDFKV